MTYFLDAALPDGTELSGVTRVMTARGYAWAQRIPRQELQFAEEIWTLPDGRGAVRYVYDHFVDVPTIRAESELHGEPGNILIDLGRDLPLLDTSELTDQAMEELPGRAYALRALAASTERYHGGVIKAFKAAIKDADPAIRRIALKCVSRYPAFALAQDLDDQAALETEAALREEQRALAADVRAHGKRGTLW